MELQLVYTGNLQMTLQTKFNLSKLGKDGGQETVHCMTETGSSRSVRHTHVFTLRSGTYLNRNPIDIFLHITHKKELNTLPVHSPSCRPILSVLADSDEESSSAGSSDEEELLLSEPQGLMGEKGCPPATEG